MNRREALQWMGTAATGMAVPTFLGCQAYDQAPGLAKKTLKLVQHFDIRRAQDRGGANHGWLRAKHSFSFARYRDPKHMGFRALRVLNEDVIAPKGGFPMHPHRDMEILTFILDGALEHKDSMGHGSVIRPGEVQAMSAGTGVRHSEFNPSASEHVHLLQIWLKPDRRHQTPRYQQKPIVRGHQEGPSRLIASPDGRQGSVAMYQDAFIHACQFKARETMSFEVRPGRHTWIQIARGELVVNGQTLKQGDGLSTSNPGFLMFESSQKSQVLVFDLA